MHNVHLRTKNIVMVMNHLSGNVLIAIPIL